MKRVALVVALTMLLLSAAWAAGGSEGQAQDGGPVGLRWLTGVWANQVDPNGYLNEAALEAVNVDLELEVMPAAQLTQRTQVLFAGGDYPEIITIGPGPLLSQNAANGTLVNMDPYWEDYPALVEGYPRDNAALSPMMVDGSIYMVPVMLADSRFNFAIRQDWLDAVGMDAPTTVEELYEVGRAFREGDPDGDGERNTFAWGMDRNGGTIVDIVNPGFGIPGNFLGYYLTAGGDVAPNFLHPNAADAIAFLKRSYEEGLLFPDSVTQIYAEQEKDFLSGQTGVMLGNNSKAAFFEDTLQEAFADGQVTYVDPLVSADGKQQWQFYSPVWRGAAVTAAANTETKVRAAMELFNWMVGEGDEIVRFGPEGVYWTERGSHGMPILEGDGYDRWYRTGEGYHELHLIISPYKTESFISPQLWADEEQVETQIAAFEQYRPYAVFDPTIGITTPLKTEYEATLREIILADIFDIIVGGEPLSSLDALESDWAARGGPEMIEEINAAYQARQ